MRATAVPLFLIQAFDDVHLTPTYVLGGELAAHDKVHETRIYPAIGTAPGDGHGVFNKAVDLWFPDVLRSSSATSSLVEHGLSVSVRRSPVLTGTFAWVASAPATEVEVDGRRVRISNPDRVYFPVTGATKLDLVHYYLAVGPGIVNALRERPCMMHRFPKGVAEEKVHQKRVPHGAPSWLETVRVHFPRYGLHADELCVTELAQVIWAVQMSTVEFHPWNSRRADVEKPDEWRIDLDPMPRCPPVRVRRVARVVHEVLDELGAVGWPKTSGGKGMHVYVRIDPAHSFGDVRRAALAFAREVERRAPDDVTTTWWRKDRDPAALFVDYNQNARDHTMAAAYSVRGVPTATVSTPVRWDEIDDADAGDFTMATVPQRFAELGDLHAPIDDAVFAIDDLLEWAARDEHAGEVDPGTPDDDG